jgi:hypothetical protein
MRSRETSVADYFHITTKKSIPMRCYIIQKAFNQRGLLAKRGLSAEGLMSKEVYQQERLSAKRG